MKKIDLPKTEKIGYIVSSERHVDCPYCSETNCINKEHDIYVEDDVKMFMCRFCKFSFKVVERNAS